MKEELVHIKEGLKMHPIRSKDKSDPTSTKAEKSDDNNKGSFTPIGKKVNITIKDIPIGDIKIKDNIRKEYAGLEELKANIREYGLIQPITVYEEGDGYIVKIGHRRFMAYQALFDEEPGRFHSIRCIVDDAGNSAVFQLVENVQRVDLPEIDFAYAFKTLKDQGMKIKQIAEVIGRDEGYTRNLSMGVNEITNDDDLKELVCHAGVTILDIVETKGILFRQKRLDLLEQYGKGEITRKELRKKVDYYKKGKTAAKPLDVVQEHPITSSVANDVAIAEDPAAASDTPAIPATPDVTDLANSQGAPDSVSANERLGPFPILIEVKSNFYQRRITVHALNVKNEQTFISLEEDLRAFFTAHQDKYDLIM